MTINKMNTLHEMNAGQFNMDLEVREEESENVNKPTHLRPRPTKWNERYIMMQIGKQSKIAKQHLHVKLNQMGIKEGIRKFGEKGNNTLLKELNQLHERNVLMPKKNEEFTHDKRMKVLR